MECHVAQSLDASADESALKESSTGLEGSTTVAWQGSSPCKSIAVTCACSGTLCKEKLGHDRHGYCSTVDTSILAARLLIRPSC